MARKSVAEVRSEVLRLRTLGKTDAAIAASLRQRGWSRPTYAARWTAEVVAHFITATAPPTRTAHLDMIHGDAPAPSILT